jgi:CheY-like chemotaxis protein
VDDDDDIREAVMEVLKMEGFTVQAATNGHHALQILENSENLPDVILLDLIMPVKDGYQFRAGQLSNRRLADIPVVMMTANLNPDDRAAGVNAFLRKPVNVSDMVEALKGAILSQRN